MSVQLTSKEVVALVGCKATHSIRQSSHLRYESAEEKRVQEGSIAEILTVLQQFHILPCDLTLKVGAENGRSIFEGTVEPYDKGSEDIASKLLIELTEKAFDFAQHFPLSKLSITMTQAVEITSVDG